RSGKQGGKFRAQAKTRFSQAGLQFPVSCVHRLLRKGNYAERVGAPVYLTAVLEYLTAEILEQYCPREQEDSHHPLTPPAGCLQQQGAQQADPIHPAGIVGGGVTKCYCTG
ncbi:unnamed protein product, partial [Staurois parvus]